MPQCKAKTTDGKRCRNPATGDTDYCHIPSHQPQNEGKSYWTFREKHGRDPIFKSPDDLWKQCRAYFQWVEENPLKEEKVFHSQGEITRTEVSKMRAMTIEGMCLYLGIDVSTWHNYRNREDFFGVTTRAEAIIYAQKFEGASADLLNSNIIARDLGLKDRKELSGGLNVNVSELTDEQVNRIADGEDPRDVIGS